MSEIIQIKLKAGEPEERLVRKLEKKLRVPAGKLGPFHIVSESVDARKKPEIYRVFNIELGERPADNVCVSVAKPGTSAVVAGFGPCGMFAALRLARAGVKVTVLERGAAMDERVAAVERFWETGELDPSANAQFGEGGAGTFSDGKLTTGTKSPYSSFILEAMVKAGAPEDILYKQKAHVGTDILRGVVVNIRKEIEALGGEVLFNTKLESLIISDNKICGARTADGRIFETDSVIIALGHSARDSVRYLYDIGLSMEQKPFSMGVRIEHRQKDIDIAQYGRTSEELGLTPADYKLSVKCGDGRGVYTFCMCPGGYVAACASAPGLLVTNGMSNRARDAENANSALLCDVRPEDFASDSPLAGLEFQEKYEALAFELGGSNYRAPAQYVGSFLGKNKAPQNPVTPSYRPGVTMTEISKCLPDFVAKDLKEALPLLGRKLKGFDAPGALLTAIESRSSSPVRIKRAATLCAVAADGFEISGLYPGGEGAGYAGGIMSAAQDGVRLAEQIISLHL